MAHLNLSWSSSNQHGLRNLVTWIAAGIPLLMAAIIPMGWFIAGYAHETSRITAISDLAADEISRFIYFNPEFWQFDEHHLAQIMTSYVHQGNVHRIRMASNDGRQILQIGPEPLWPILSYSTELSDGSRIVGSLEMAHSLSPKDSRKGTAKPYNAL